MYIQEHPPPRGFLELYAILLPTSAYQPTPLLTRSREYTVHSPSGSRRLSTLDLNGGPGASLHADPGLHTLAALEGAW